MRVIFAAHPHSNYHLRTNLLFGKTAKIGITAELVQDASLAFSHFSTAVSFPVLWQKPMVFLKTKQFTGTYLGYCVEQFADELAAPIVNMSGFDETDLPIDLSEWFAFDRDSYKRYKDLYIKYPGSPELPLWEHVSEKILMWRSND